MAEEGQVISCHSLDAWNEQLEKGNNDSNKLHALLWAQCMAHSKERLWSCSVTIVVDFTASWCGPCRFIAPYLAELAKKYPHATFLKVDVDELKTVAADWAVEAMPTFMFLKDGKIVDKVVGADKNNLQITVAKHLPTA